MRSLGFCFKTFPKILGIIFLSLTMSNCSTKPISTPDIKTEEKIKILWPMEGALVTVEPIWVSLKLPTESQACCLVVFLDDAYLGSFEIADSKIILPILASGGHTLRFFGVDKNLRYIPDLWSQMNIFIKTQTPRNFILPKTPTLALWPTKIPDHFQIVLGPFFNIDKNPPQELSVQITMNDNEKILHQTGIYKFRQAPNRATLLWENKPLTYLGSSVKLP